MKFVSEVLPAAIAKAASGETGSVQAAKLVAEVIGATGKKGGPVGRPPNEEKPESGPTLEEKLTKLTKQATPTKKAKARPKLPRKGKK